MKELEITVSSVSSFYSMVHYLVRTLGSGKDKWTARGRPLSRIKRYGSTVVVLLIPEDTPSEIVTELILMME